MKRSTLTVSIKDTGVHIDDRNNLVCSFVLVNEEKEAMWSFLLGNNWEVEKLHQLFKFAEVFNLKDLENKQIRVVNNSYGQPHAFGHLTEDKFFKLGGPLDVLSYDKIIDNWC